MPVVTIQVTREGTRPGASSVTAEEKAALIKGASQLLLDVLNKPLDATYVIIQEVDASNWGWGGLPALEIPTAPHGGDMPPKWQINTAPSATPPTASTADSRADRARTPKS